MRLRGALTFTKNGERVRIPGKEFGHEEEGSAESGFIFLHHAQTATGEIRVEVRHWPLPSDYYEVVVDHDTDSKRYRPGLYLDLA